MTAEEKYADKIAKLLRKAESTTPAEAEALVQKAQELMTEYAIDEAMIARAQGKDIQQIVQEEITYTGIYHQPLFTIGKAVAINNDCRTLIRREDKGSTLIIIGFEDDVRRTKMLDSSVQIQAQGALAKYWKDVDSSWMSAMMKFKNRREFLFGFGGGLNEQLMKAHEAGKKSAEANEASRQGVSADVASESVALVLRSKQERVTDWVDEKYGSSLHRVRSNCQSGSADARYAGSAAGRSADAGGVGRVAGGMKALGA